MKKILIVNATFGLGSTGFLVKDIAEYCLSKGDNVYVYCMSNDSHLDLPITILKANWIETRFHAFLGKVFGKQGFYSSFSTKKLISFIKRENIDVVHLNNMHSNFVHVGKLISFLHKSRTKTIWTIHDCWPFTGGCVSYSSIHCNKWITGCSKCNLKRCNYYLGSVFFDSSSKNFRTKKSAFVGRNITFVGVSNWITGELRKSFLSKEKIVTINNWVSKEDNINYDVDVSNQYKRIIFISTFISKEKGYDVMSFLANHLSDKYKIFCVGKNVDNLPINERIIMLGSLKKGQVLSLLSKCDVCVNTTSGESFGLVTAESLLCGTPVIVFNNTFSKEVIDGQNGFVIDETNYKETIIQRIDTLCNSNKSFISNYCVEYAKKNFNKEIQLSKYYDIFS